MDSHAATWVTTQQQTIINWANQLLSSHGMQINDLQEDLKDGVVLIMLLRVLSGKDIPCKENPKNRFEKLSNVSTALDFIKVEGLALISVGPEDIVEGNLRMIMGTLWTLLLRFNVAMDPLCYSIGPRTELWQWVNSVVAPYNLDRITNFTTHWQDGKAMMALADSFKPGCLLKGRNLAEMSEEPAKMMEEAFAFAENELQIPRRFDANDIIKNPDDQHMMFYVSSFRDLFWEGKRKVRQAAIRGWTPEEHSLFSKEFKENVKVWLLACLKLKEEGHYFPVELQHLVIQHLCRLHYPNQI